MTHPDESFFRERGFGRKIGYGGQPAVIVIDLLKGFTDPTFPLGSDLDAVLSATSQVLAAARDVSAPIFHTAVGYGEDLRDAGIWGLKLEALRSMLRGSEATELEPRLGRLPGEPIVLKKYASAFFGTDLVSRLSAQAVDTLVITGCTTSGCVRATAVDALRMDTVRSSCERRSATEPKRRTSNRYSISSRSTLTSSGSSRCRHISRLYTPRAGRRQGTARRSGSRSARQRSFAPPG
jgi:nicotinamidase-related amidase